MRHPVNQVPAHWSKDFVEHLRTVHLTLVAVSVATIVIVLSVKPYNPAIAARELHQIIQLKKLWSPQWVWSHGQVEPTAKTEIDPMNEVTLTSDAKILLARVSNYRAPNGHTVDELVVFDMPSENYIQESTGRIDLKTFPESLNEFEKWWRDLAQPEKASFPTRIELGVERGYFTMSFMPLAAATWITAKHYQLALSHLDSIYSGHAPIYDRNGKVEKSFRFEIKILSMDKVSLGRDGLVTYFGNWHTGEYTDAFVDLKRAARDFDALEFEDVEKILDADAAKGAEVFEVLGIKIPVEQVTTWGSLIILGVQVYLLLFLKQLNGKLRADDPGWDVPWIAMDTSRSAQIVLFIGLVALPVVAVGLLSSQAFLVFLKTALPDGAWHGLLYHSEPVALVVALMASISLGILSWRFRPKVEAEEPSYSSPLFY